MTMTEVAKWLEGQVREDLPDFPSGVESVVIRLEVMHPDPDHDIPDEETTFEAHLIVQPKTQHKDIEIELKPSDGRGSAG